MTDSQLLQMLAPDLKDPSVDDLLALANNKSVDGRRELFQTVQDLFVDDKVALSDRERALAGEILLHLLHDVEMALRLRLSEQLADRDDLPRALIVELANDEIDIASPVLLANEALQDDDLIEIIRHRTMEHQVAISMRPKVNEAVSEALVNTGNEHVVASLLRNHGAAISRAVMDHLVSESERVDQYQEPLVRRPDLPAELAERMYSWVSNALKKHIQETFDLSLDRLDGTFETAARRTLEDHERDADSQQSSDALADRLFDLGELNGAFFVKTLKSGDIELFKASLCRLSGLTPKALQRILFDENAEALAFVCKSLDFDGQVFLEISELARGSRDDCAVKDTGHSERLMNMYREIAKENADRVVARWRRSARYQQTAT